MVEKLYSILPVYPLYLFPAIIPTIGLCYGLVALGRIGKGTKDTICS